MEERTFHMVRGLTKKQRVFVNEYADTGNATEAAFKAYDTDDKEVASVIGYENLTKPQIVNELKKLGFDSNNAKRVIGEILNDTAAEPKDRIKAAENVFKVHGDYAPDKFVSLSAIVEISKEDIDLAAKLKLLEKEL